jgi:hypothetical protein
MVGLPVAVRLPATLSEKALVVPVKEGSAGLLGKMTLGICLLVMPEPLISSMYLE